MNLLIISYYLPPLVNPQSFQIGRLLYHLPPQYKMYAVTADDNTFQKDRNLYGDLRERFADAMTIDNSLISKAAKFGLPGVFLLWHIRAYRKIVKKWGKRQFDCIVTFSHPIAVNLLGMALKRFFNIRWVAFFSDPWVDNPYYIYKGVKKKINLYFERKAMETADALVFTSPEAQNLYNKKYPFIANKTTFLEHSFDPDLYGKNAAVEKNNKVTMRYVGALYGERTAEHLLTAIGKCSIAGKIDFLFEIVGSVDKEHMIRYSSILKEYDLDRVVEFKQSVPYLESLRLMKESDILVIIDAQIDGSVFLPSKLIDYIGSGRPILAITPKNGATARVIKKAGGWLVEPNDVDGMAKALRDILDNYKNGKLEQFSPSTEAAQEYAISCNIGKFIDILNGKVNAG